MLSECDAVALLRRAERRSNDVWLNGGWGVDALLGEVYPVQAFSGRGIIGGVELHCIPPAEQVMFRVGYEFDEDDVREARLLCERFDLPASEEYRMAMDQGA